LTGMKCPMGSKGPGVKYSSSSNCTSISNALHDLTYIFYKMLLIMTKTFKKKIQKDFHIFSWSERAVSDQLESGHVLIRKNSCYHAQHASF
jgi:hypothetical protein